MAGGPFSDGLVMGGAVSVDNQWLLVAGSCGFDASDAGSDRDNGWLAGFVGDLLGVWLLFNPRGTCVWCYSVVLNTSTRVDAKLSPHPC